MKLPDVFLMTAVAEGMVADQFPEVPSGQVTEPVPVAGAASE